MTRSDQELADEVAACYADPLRFVQTMYPWGEPGALAPYTGPDVWQAAFLRRVGDQVRQRGFDGHTPVKPLRFATSSGHGPGKSTLVAWLVDWIMSTRPHAQGTITANTFTQLETKTWAAIQRWTKLCLTAGWFEITATRFAHPQHKASWFCTPQSCREENSEAFAGQHAATSTSFYINDEDSAVPDAIHEVEEGGLTDGEPMIFLFGNPTRSTGAFYRACFGAGRGKWQATVVDSRTAAFTNKAQIDEWIEEYGEDSDFVRVRVRGLPPRASDAQYIDLDTIRSAQTRILHPLPDEPLVAGFDIARGGEDQCVLWFRRGLDARSIPPIRIPGEEMRDSMRLISVLVDVLARSYEGRTIHTLFLDATAIGGPILDRLHQLGHKNVIEVQSGMKAPDPKCANMRAYMWMRGREWLARGAIPDDPRLEVDLSAPGYDHDKRSRLVIESKKSLKARGMSSSDDSDALFLTLAYPIGVKPRAKSGRGQGGRVEVSDVGWMA